MIGTPPTRGTGLLWNFRSASGESSRPCRTAMLRQSGVSTKESRKEHKANAVIEYMGCAVQCACEFELTNEAIRAPRSGVTTHNIRSEEHTSELQSLRH